MQHWLEYSGAKVNLTVQLRTLIVSNPPQVALIRVLFHSIKSSGAEFGSDARRCAIYFQMDAIFESRNHWTQSK